MNINGFGIPGYPAGYRSKKVAASAAMDSAGIDFASRISQVKTAYSYETYRSKNYKIVPDNENACFTIYNKDGERLGAFFYADIKIKQDSATGKQFLISEKGTAWYDALAIDDELKTDLQNVMGTDSLSVETLRGYTVKTHAGTGIQYLLKDGEEGRGGKVLLQSEEDVGNYEALAENYLHKYPSLIKDNTAAHIYADLEIRGLVQHMKDDALPSSERSVWEREFDRIGANAPECVKKAWLDAADAVGVDGMGITKSGKMDHISQLLVQQISKGLRGETGSDDILGNTVQSAVKAVEKALYDLEHPLAGNYGRTPEQIRGRELEKKFYEEFLQILRLSS